MGPSAVTGFATHARSAMEARQHTKIDPPESSQAYGAGQALAGRNRIAITTVLFLTTLKAEVDEEAWATLHSDVSRPFEKPESGRIAVKVINHLGDEVMKVFRV